MGSPASTSKLYGLAPVAKYFTTNRLHRGSLSPFLTMIQDRVMTDIWYHLKDAVLEGVAPFDRASKDEHWAQVAKASFGDFSPLIMEKIVESYDGFEGLNSLVDVAGGDGSCLSMILSKYPSIKGINYDLAHVIEKAPSYLGIEHVVGDMFVSIPKADAIFTKGVTHAMDDGRVLKILRNGYEALPAIGKLLTVDMVMPDVPEADVADKTFSQFYLFLTSVNPRGKRRTLKEFRVLAKDAGFSGARVACRTYNYSLLEFIKNL